ncbi:MAG: DNA polymerase IV [Gemmiger sp.]|uniref:DNA polymerase Y family protein n=1 Tax=Gemmiger sp. TaxID=2049027 RepID=UPI002E772FB2|nr:DNA polymerase IV [Gemmiger sp.]MEE0708923.1 DNA polymerase IV [Gemmiger sp.]
MGSNAYLLPDYASVEMQENPQLRGKRIAVCGSKEDRHGIVLTASYPAKWMGVKTGMAIWQAQQCCRDLIIVPPHYTEYLRYSGFVREILQDYSDQIEGFGLDESWIDITGSIGLYGSPMKIAKEISDRVKRELGITVSIGVSNNKVTAKLGSDYKKPDGITRIEPDNYKELVYPLPVQDLLYVGPATQRKLNSYGIRTIGQLAETNPKTLQGWFGKVGYALSAFARGLDTSPVARQDHTATIKSVGNSGTTPRDLVNNEDIWLMLLIMSESVAMRMRELGMKCTVVEVSVRDSNLMGFVRQRKIETPTNGALEIAKIAFELFKSNYRWGNPLRSVGVRGAGLVPEDCAIQLGFFSNQEKREQLERLDKAVDTVRQRYGYTCVQRARIYTDKGLGKISPKEDHLVHPVGFFNAG